ncbi:MAG: hypothetical protein WBR24_07640 [Desulfobacterales bacterium]|jgi:hypothetical protein
MPEHVDQHPEHVDQQNAQQKRRGPLIELLAHEIRSGPVIKTGQSSLQVLGRV